MGARATGRGKRSGAWQLGEAFHRPAKAVFCPRGAKRIHQPATNPTSHSHGLQAPHTSSPSTRARRSRSSGVQGAQKGPTGQRPPPGQHPVTNLAAKGPQKYLSSCCPAAPRLAAQQGLHQCQDLAPIPTQPAACDEAVQGWLDPGGPEPQDRQMGGGEGTQGSVPKLAEAPDTHHHC